MKTENIINEFLNNKYQYIDIIERFIFFEDMWMFPDKNSLNNFLDDKLPDEYFNLANNIVKKMNDRNINPEKYDREIFNIIIKEL